MEKYKKIVNMTYFTKGKKIDINDSIDRIVYLEVDSPLNYGARTWDYYGRIVKITNCYFWIIEYCDGFLNSWQKDQIQRAENEHLAKKWHKKSIRKLYEVKTEEKNEEIEYEKSSY